MLPRPASTAIRRASGQRRRSVANTASAARCINSKPGIPHSSIAARSMRRVCSAVYSETVGSDGIESGGVIAGLWSTSPQRIGCIAVDSTAYVPITRDGRAILAPGARHVSHERHRLSTGSPRTSATGVPSSASAGSASPASSSARTKRISFDWLDAGYHGEMDYMARHGTRRSRPDDLAPGTVRVISARMDYAPPGIDDAWDVLSDDGRAYVSRYALGRDYHKVLRQRLQKLADRIGESHRSVRLSRLHRFGAGAGKSARARCRARLDRQAHAAACRARRARGSFSARSTPICRCRSTRRRARIAARCTRCIDICPTQAIVAPYRARCAALHFVPHDRAARLDSGRAASADRQPRVRLRRLPARLSVEQVRAAHDGERISRRGTGSIGAAGRSLRVERSGIPRTHRRHGDPAHGLRRLVAQYRGGARQRAVFDCERASAAKSCG